MSSTLERPVQLGKYEILARIAKGGMAEIYIARQRGVVGFSRLVVIKRILPHLAEEPAILEMFLQEARLAAQVNHPNVVQIFDVGHWEGSYFIAMEYIEGSSVSAMCRLAYQKGGAIPYRVAGEIVAQACEGLHAAHQLRGDDGQPLGLVHRDVSPQNLMVSVDGRVKLVDFGIAKAKGSSVRTHTGQIKGKYPYMSPEQCRGEPLDRSTDIFSLGIVFYEMVVARRLFKRRTELMTLKAITEDPLPVPAEMREGIPGPISDLILHALERYPEDRFTTAEEMGRAARETMTELGHDGALSPELLAGYLKEECRELLEARQDALRRVQRPDRKLPSILDLDGLDEGSLDESPDSTVPASPRSIHLMQQEQVRPPGSPLPLRRVLLLALAVLLVSTLGGFLVRHLFRPGRPSGPALLMELPPSFPRDVGQRDLLPFVEYLEPRIQRRIEVSVADSYPSLTADLIKGRVQIAMLPALQLVLARDRNPRLRVVAALKTEDSRHYQGYIISRMDNEIVALDQLVGKRFCYVDRGSTSGYLLPRYYLRKRGIDPDEAFKEPRYSGNHADVMRDILNGLCDVGAVYSGAWNSSRVLGINSGQLKILFTTGQIPYDAFCVSTDVSNELAQKLRRAFLELNPKKHLGSETVGETFRFTGFVKANHLEEYELVKDLARSAGLL